MSGRANLCDAPFVAGCVAERPSLGLAALSNELVALVVLVFFVLSWQGLLKVTKSRSTPEMLRWATWPGLTSFFAALKSDAVTTHRLRGQHAVRIMLDRERAHSVFWELAAYVLGFALVWGLSSYFIRDTVFVTVVLAIVLVVLTGLNMAATSFEEGIGEYHAAMGTTQRRGWVYALINAFMGGMVFGVAGIFVYYIARMASGGWEAIGANLALIFVSVYFVFALVTWYGASQGKADKAKYMKKAKEEHRAALAAQLHRSKVGVEEYQRLLADLGRKPDPGAESK